MGDRNHTHHTASPEHRPAHLVFGPLAVDRQQLHAHHFSSLGGTSCICLLSWGFQAREEAWQGECNICAVGLLASVHLRVACLAYVTIVQLSTSKHICLFATHGRTYDVYMLTLLLLQQAFESVKARTSIVPFQAIWEGRQKLPSYYYREFFRVPYVAVTLLAFGTYWAHPLMQSASHWLGW